MQPVPARYWFDDPKMIMEDESTLKNLLQQDRLFNFFHFFTQF